MKYTICFLLCLLPIIASDFFVSTSGNDHNPGSKQKPFQTIQKAIDASSKTAENDTITVFDGNYQIDNTLMIQHSGVTIQAQNPKQKLSSKTFQIRLPS